MYNDSYPISHCPVGIVNCKWQNQMGFGPEAKPWVVVGVPDLFFSPLFIFELCPPCILRSDNYRNSVKQDMEEKMVALEAGQCIYSIWGIYYPDRYLIGTQVNFGKSVTGLAVEIGNLSSLCQALRTALQKAVDSSQADSSLNSWGVLWVFYIDLWRN